MLKKLVLPPKPSKRGNDWVIDASHCQGCFAPFGFTNWKHYCQRCGGLFCNSCTQQRMVLRGQGDAPVRICDPCKKSEDEARLELRRGLRPRASKGISKNVSNQEDVIGEILGTDWKQDKESTNIDENDSHFAQHDEAEVLTSILGRKEKNLAEVSDAATPEELRRQAAEEKLRYKALKSEGKNAEALQAFKHGKELERQAAAEELAMRKSLRATLRTKASVHANTAMTEVNDSKKALPTEKGKAKEDLAHELRELGWSDAELQDANKNSSAKTLEGELSSLLGEVYQEKSNSQNAVGIDKSQVVAMKKAALALKRQGKLAEAKEELRKAKILEKQLEEQAILGDTEESDDELAALIRSIGNEKQNEGFDSLELPDLNLEQILGFAGDIADDVNLRVTDDDYNDPDLAADLKSFGWSEDDDEQVGTSALGGSSLQDEVLNLKKEAVMQKRVGNMAEATSLLKRAKLLERELGTAQLGPNISQTMPEAFENPFQAQDAVDSISTEQKYAVPKSSKSRMTIQRELLAVKKKALVLRREGKVDEADEELKKGKILEQQLQELENPNKRNLSSVLAQQNEDPGALDLMNEPEVEVTAQDMQDPSLMAALRNLGWDGDNTNISAASSSSDTGVGLQNVSSAGPEKVARKSEIQKELLASKRKALALRRQGKQDEANIELEKASLLEKKMEEMERSSDIGKGKTGSDNFEVLTEQDMQDPVMLSSLRKLGWDDGSGHVNSAIPAEKTSMLMDTGVKLESVSFVEHKVAKSRGEIQKELLAVKRKALALRRQGKTEEAEAELEKAKLLENQMEEDSSKAGNRPADPSQEVQSSAPSSDLLHLLSGQVPSPREELPTRDPQLFATGSGEQEHAGNQLILQSEVSMQRGKEIQGFITEDTRGSSVHRRHEELVADGRLEKSTETSAGSNIFTESKPAHQTNTLREEILSRKRKALALKRDGKLAEAREELRQAKLLEKSLEDGQATVNYDTKAPGSSSAGAHEVVPESKPVEPKKPISARERAKIQHEALSHKRISLQLRREGKIAEADAEYERAKQLESQVEEEPHSNADADDVAVDDLFDPQLLSALKSIGWQDSDLFGAPPKNVESAPNVKVFVGPQAEPSNKKVELKPSIESAGLQSQRTSLEEQIKAKKLKALNLKKEGKQTEALEALRGAKALEKKLASL